MNHSLEFLFLQAQIVLMSHPRIRDSELLRRIYPCSTEQFTDIMEELLRGGQVELDKEDPRMLTWKGY